MTEFMHRLATEADLPRLRALIDVAIAELQHGFLSPAQIAASHTVMGLDTQLIRDRTYFIVERQGELCGCGGWSWRTTLYGGDDSALARQSDPLDPRTDAARVRAMYTHPSFARQGIGKMVLGLCEDAAAAHGFTQTEMMATLSGEPLYHACGYREIERIVSAPVDGVTVPLVRMRKTLDMSADR